MAKGRVATAYVEVRPDTTGFARELRTKLAAMKGLDYKVPIDSKAMATDLKRDLSVVFSDLAETTAVKTAAKKVNATIVKDAQDANDKQTEQALRRNDAIDASNAKVAQAQAKRDKQSVINAQSWAYRIARTYDNTREAAAHALNKQIDEGTRLWDKYEADVAKRRLDAQKFIEKAAAKNLAEALKYQANLRKQYYDEMLFDAYRFNDEFNRALKAEQKRLDAELDAAHKLNAEIDKGTQAWDRFEREQREAIDRVRKIADDERIKQFGKDWAEAIWMNKEWDRLAKKRADESIQAFANQSVSNFRLAARQISNGWGRLMANPIGAVALALAGSFAAEFAVGLGAAGTGLAAALVGGLILKGDAKVVEAATALKDRFVQAFTLGAQPLAEPLRNMFDILREGAPGLADIGRNIFTGIAPYLDDVARSAVKASQSFGQGILKALPAIQAGMAGIAKLAERMGKVLGDAFAELGKDPTLVANSLQTLGDALEFLISGFAEATIGFAQFADGIKKGLRNFESFDQYFSSAVLETFTLGIKRTDARSEWNKFLDDLTGRTDAAADAIAAEERRITEATEKMVGDMQSKFAHVDASKIREVIEGVRKSMGDAQVGTSQFSNAVLTELIRIEKQAKTDIWSNFRADAKNGFRDVSQGAKDARDAVDDLIDSMDILDQRFIDAETASMDVADGFDEIAQAIKDGVEEGQTFTQWQRDQKRALFDQAGAITEVVKAELARGKTMQEILPIFDQQKGKWLEQAAAILGSKTEAEEFANQLRLTPEQIITQMSLLGVPEAETKVGELVKDRKFTITAEADFGSVVSNLQYIAFLSTEKGKQSGYDYATWFAYELDKNKEVQRRAGNNAAAATSDGYAHYGKQFGPQLGRDYTNDVAPDYSMAQGQGAELAKKTSYGMTTESGSAQDAGKTISNSFFTGLKATNYFQLGRQLSIDVANGILDAQGNVSSASARIAALAKQNLPANSPAEKGPLSGRGAPENLGRHFTVDVAKGMLREEDKVVYASRQIATAMTAGARVGTSGLGFTIPGPARPVTNVYIGSQRLDERVDYRIEENNTNLARAILAGRSGG